MALTSVSSSGPVPEYPLGIGSPMPVQREPLRWTDYALTILLHAGLLTALYSACYCFGLLDYLPEQARLLNWDGNNFYSIAVNDYPTDSKLGTNAFFPLFPYWWRLTGLDAVGISILNAIWAWVGAGVLALTFGLTRRQLLLLLALPSLLFTMVPYGEGLFFFFGALLLRGLHRQQVALVLLGLAGCCLARSAGTTFLPAYLFAELLTWDRRKSFGRQLGELLAGILAVVAAVVLVMWLQYRRHGDALAFYNVHSLWGHKFHLPETLLNDSAGINVLWLDLAALVVVVVALVACLALGVRWLLGLGKAHTDAPRLSKAVLFSLGYAVGAGYFIVFYQNPDIVGLSRYIFASPFFFVILAWAWQYQQTQPRLWLGVLTACVLVATLVGWPWYFDNFMPLEATWYFVLFTLYCLAFLFIGKADFRWYRELSVGLYGINLLALVYMLNLFLEGVWIN
ncbi:SulP family inorganic anion transporter [Hymenobacter jeollabukensis]|nr:SulP family inorganic anion transporter [Hymenobacter jeollabukensis]